MSAATATRRAAVPKMNRKRVIGVLVVVAIIIGMGLDTTAVPIGSTGSQANKFDPAKYGKAKFPAIQKAVQNRAVPAKQLASALAGDKSAAVDKYALAKGTFPVMAVKFSGVVGKGQLGTFHVKVDGVPDSLTIRVQTGPAITGVVLRDSDPNIQFGDFVNQIQYQNAAAGINNAMKKKVLSGLDRDHLKGKTIRVVGAFQLINPDNWMVTPVQISVQQ
ncbi:DUF2291 domain-containing protein [Salinisphaera sp.]|uniref:DUF2291 domain-containing protein n=1 Tax=Salinisphaera sp. TaxID=1914330 RepID=UPI002D788794|nr:DUF2291 domain-containing protein [Salinisphaera sp.]HET7313476.1 DUF2291 domain-containing protein [Salinisphaera sp.]